MAVAPQTHVPYAATPTVRAIDAMRFRGNVTPPPWFEHLINPRTGYAYLLAIVALGEFVYRFRGREVEDEQRARLTDIGAWFYGPKLEIDYRVYAKKFGCTPRQFRDAVSFLVADGAVLRDVVPVYGVGGKLAGQKILIDLNPERIAFLNTPLGEVDEDYDRDLPSDDMAEDGDFSGLDSPPCDDVRTPCSAISSDLTEKSHVKESLPPSPPVVPAGDPAPARAVGGAARAAGGGLLAQSTGKGRDAHASLTDSGAAYEGAWDRGPGEAPRVPPAPQTMSWDEFARICDKEFKIDRWATLQGLALDYALVVKRTRRKIRNEPKAGPGALLKFIREVGPTLIDDEPAPPPVATRDEPDMPPPGPPPGPVCPVWAETAQARRVWGELPLACQRLVNGASLREQGGEYVGTVWLTKSPVADRQMDQLYQNNIAQLLEAAGYTPRHAADWSVPPTEQLTSGPRNIVQAPQYRPVILPADKAA